MNAAAQTTKTLAQKIAKQMAQEPLELLKSARSQVTGQEFENESNTLNEEQVKAQHEQALAEDNAKSSRLMAAFERELEDIRKQELLKELQKKISEGIEIPLEDYPELSLEHKQVLLAQMEAVKARNQQAIQQKSNEIVEPASKKGRKLFNFGKKTAVKREQTHVEKVVPPSG